MSHSEIYLDKRTELIWQAFKLYLPPGTRLTDAIRPPMVQLEIIVTDAKNEGYVFKKAATLEDRSSWKPAHLFLKSKGYDIAEPRTSMHGRRYAFDLGGPDLKRIEHGLLRPPPQNRIPLI